MATKNIKNKAGKNSILKNPVVIVLTFIAMTALILASSFCTAQKNKVDITQIVLNGNIQLAVGENQAVGFNVATPKVLAAAVQLMGMGKAKRPLCVFAGRRTYE